MRIINNTWRFDLKLLDERERERENVVAVSVSLLRYYGNIVPKY